MSVVALACFHQRRTRRASMRSCIFLLIMAGMFFLSSVSSAYSCPDANDGTEKYYDDPDSAFCYYFIPAGDKQCSLAAPDTKAEFDVLLKHIKAHNRNFPGANAYSTGLVSNKLKKKIGNKNYQLQEYATEREVDNYLNLNLIDAGILIIDTDASAKLVPKTKITNVVTHAICQLPAEKAEPQLQIGEREASTAPNFLKTKNSTATLNPLVTKKKRRTRIKGNFMTVNPHDPITSKKEDYDVSLVLTTPTAVSPSTAFPLNSFILVALLGVLIDAN